MNEDDKISNCKKSVGEKVLRETIEFCLQGNEKNEVIKIGCDIHVCCERKNYKGEWINCDYFKLNPYFDVDDDEDDKWWIVPIFDDRNYELFATLADVRNYGYIKPISEPRGLPEDIHYITKELADSWGDDGHSHSYYTLKELMDYMTNAPTITYSGMISEEQCQDLDKYNIYPTFWCLSTTMDGYTHRTWTVPDDNVPILIEAMKKRCAEEYFIYEWCKDYEEQIKKQADNFRIVFWFDN